MQTNVITFWPLFIAVSTYLARWFLLVHWSFLYCHFGGDMAALYYAWHDGLSYEVSLALAIVGVSEKEGLVYCKKLIIKNIFIF